MKNPPFTYAPLIFGEDSYYYQDERFGRQPTVEWIGSNGVVVSQYIGGDNRDALFYSAYLGEAYDKDVSTFLGSVMYQGTISEALKAARKNSSKINRASREDIGRAWERVLVLGNDVDERQKLVIGDAVIRLYSTLH